jgi:hypothetical protein
MSLVICRWLSVSIEIRVDGLLCATKNSVYVAKFRVRLESELQ